MLSERVGELLSAYVDGELGARRRRAVERLLAASAEARAMMQQLKRDADTLRSLPRQALSNEFPQQVLRRIAERRLHPVRPAPVPGPWPIPAWFGLAAAAVVLLGISVASYFYFAAAWKRSDGPALADHRTGPAPEHSRLPRPEAPAPVATPEPAKHQEQKSRPDEAPPPSAIVRGPDKAPSLPGPELSIDERMNERDLSTALARQKDPDPKFEVFERLNLWLALTFPVRDLEQDQTKQRLRQELKRGSAFRVELSCLGQGKAFQRLQDAFQTQGIRLLIDQVAEARLQNRSLKTDYVLYCQDITAEELAAILERLSRQEKKTASRAPSDRQFDEVTVERLSLGDHVKLSALLGVDPARLPSPGATAPLGVDIHKPLSESTAEEVAKVAAGQGRPRPATGKAGAHSQPERVALVLAFNPVRHKPASSKEVKAFLGPRDRRPGALQVLLILRGANG